MPLTLAQFESTALPTLWEYATIPALSAAYDPEWERHGHLYHAAELLTAWARDRVLQDFTVVLRTIDGRSPVIVVTVAATAPCDGTVLLYGHLDKQPPLGEWSEGLHPFQPVRRGDRVYARGVADDGYALFAALLALEELEREDVGHARCVILIEASEESGSPDLGAHLEQMGDELGDVELVLCLDSSAFTYDRLWVTSSLRGNLIVELRVDVLEQGKHSGAASGVVPSSFRVVRQLLDRLEDARTGELMLPELRSDIPADHRAAAQRVTNEFGDVAGNDQPVVDGLELMGSSDADRLLQRTWAATVSVTGIGGIPDVTSAGNVLRPYTAVVLSLRLPPNVSGEVAEAAVRRTLLADPPAGARVSVTTDVADGWLCPPVAPWLHDALDDASQRTFGKPAEYAGEGGTIPFLAVLGEKFPAVQFVATGVLGPGSNAHGIDEMLDLPTVVHVTNAMALVVAAHARHTNHDSA